MYVAQVSVNKSVTDDDVAYFVVYGSGSAEIDNHVRVKFADCMHQAQCGACFCDAGLYVCDFGIWDGDVNLFLFNCVS